MRRLRNFFRFPFSEASTSRPRQMPNDSYEKPLLLGDLLPSRWSRCTSGRRPFRIYNFLLEEIDFQLALQFHSNAHGALPFAILVRGNSY